MGTAVAPPATIGRRYKVGAAVAVLMIALALVGVGLTTTDRATARRYWMCLVPAYGVLCIVTAWFRSRQGAALGVGAVVHQMLHWLTITAAVGLDFWISGTGEQAGGAGGFNALLLLAVGCVLAGYPPRPALRTGGGVCSRSHSSVS